MLGKLNAWEAERFPSGREAWERFVQGAVAELSPALKAGFVILLYERCLPHGGIRWIRVNACEKGPVRLSATVRLAGAAFPVPAKDGAATQLAASEEASRTIKTLIRDALVCTASISGNPVKDGHCCELVLIRDSALVLRREILLSAEGIDETHPVVRLCRAILKECVTIR